MKNLIKKEIDRARRINPKNKSLVLRLNKLLEQDAIYKDDFLDEALIIRRDDFAREYPKENLNEQCDNVIRYIGDYYIQMLNNGFYFFSYGEDSIMSTDIKYLEERMFNYISNTNE